MSYSLIAGCLWLIAANLIAMFPSRDCHWTNAYILIALGVPILAWTFWTNGALVAFAFLLGGMSVLRWPVYFLGRWFRSVMSL
jgi:hypothetical protein